MENKLNWVQLSFHFKESQILPFLLLFTACFKLNETYSGARKMFFKSDLREYLVNPTWIDCG
ncbi:hypothetical protein [Sphingobacterium sp.]|uniref:hypothetical protein n=1 Tax=Sphingobacterium sp. TaxID=341027 RepID=UPI002FDD9025